MTQAMRETRADLNSTDIKEDLNKNFVLLEKRTFKSIFECE